MSIERARDLATRWHWTRIYERAEKARREGAIVTQPLEEPAFGIDEAGRVELRAWVCGWLAELRLGDLSAALDLLCESAPLRFGR